MLSIFSRSKKSKKAAAAAAAVPSIQVSRSKDSLAGESSTSNDPSSSDDETDRSHPRTESGKSRRHTFSSLFRRGRDASPTHSLKRTRSASVDRMPRTESMESDAGSVVNIVPKNAFNDSNSSLGSDGEDEEEEDEEELGGVDSEIMANTQANASALTPIDFLQAKEQPVPFIGQAPNLTAPPKEYNPFGTPQNRRSKAAKDKEATGTTGMKLEVSRPVYERNRCTIKVTHGDPDKAAEQSRKTRIYFVASDMSDESSYAIEWCVGTCMRQGDECLFTTVMETDSKFDPDEGESGDKLSKIRNQKERQEKATLLVRKATALLERTKLNVRVTCQAVHAKNARHMIVDMIDWIEPTLVIVGSRGLSSLKGTLMGSVSHYLVQKSAVPVMVARRRLQAPPRVYRKKGDLDRTARVPLDQAVVEKEGNTKQARSSTDSDEGGKQARAGQEESKATTDDEGKKPEEESDLSRQTTLED